MDQEKRAEKALEVLAGLENLLKISKEIKENAQTISDHHWCFSEADNWRFTVVKIEDALHSCRKAVRRTNEQPL